MTYEPIPVLAVTFPDVLFWVIVIGSIVGSLISKHFKERKERAGDGASTIGGKSRNGYRSASTMARSTPLMNDIEWTARYEM